MTTLLPAFLQNTVYPAVLLGVSGTVNYYLVGGEIARLKEEVKDFEAKVKEGFEEIETEINKLRFDAEKLAVELKSHKLDDKETKCDIKDIGRNIKPLIEYQEVFEGAFNEKIVKELTKVAKEHSKDS